MIQGPLYIRIVHISLVFVSKKLNNFVGFGRKDCNYLSIFYLRMICTISYRIFFRSFGLVNINNDLPARYMKLIVSLASSPAVENRNTRIARIPFLALTECC